MDDDYKIKPLHTMLPKASPYVKSCDGKTTWMYILINNDLFKKYDIWIKVSNSIKKEDKIIL